MMNEELQRELERTRSKLQTAAKLGMSLSETNQELVAENSGLHRKLSALQHQFSMQERKAKAVRDTYQRSRERLSEADEQIADLEKALVDERTHAKAQKQAHVAFKGEAQKQRVAKEEYQQETEKLQLVVERLRKDNRVLQQEVQKNASEGGREGNRASRKSQEQESTERQLQMKQHKRVAKMRADISQLKAKLEDAERDAVAAAEERDSAQEALRVVNDKYGAASSSLRRAKEEIAELKEAQSESEHRARHGSDKDMVDEDTRYRSYSAGENLGDALMMQSGASSAAAAAVAASSAPGGGAATAATSAAGAATAMGGESLGSPFKSPAPSLVTEKELQPSKAELDMETQLAALKQAHNDLRLLLAR